MTDTAATPATPYMVMLVLQQIDRLDAVLSAWRAIGVPGATIVESTGTYARERRRHIASRFPFAQASPADMERGQFTLFAAVEDASWADRCLEAAESVVGDLSEPNTGIFLAWPLAQAKGIRKGGNRTEGAP